MTTVWTCCKQAKDWPNYWQPIIKTTQSSAWSREWCSKLQLGLKKKPKIQENPLDKIYPKILSLIITGKWNFCLCLIRAGVLPDLEMGSYAMVETIYIVVSLRSTTLKFLWIWFLKVNLTTLVAETQSSRQERVLLKGRNFGRGQHTPKKSQRAKRSVPSVKSDLKLTQVEQNFSRRIPSAAAY